MPDLDIVGSAAVDVVPIIPNFHAKLKALVLPIATRVGEEAGEKMGDAISRNIVIAIPSAVTQGGRAAQAAAVRQGSDTGGAFARSLRTKLTVAFKAMPKLDIRLGDTGVDAELARVRAKLEALSNRRIGIDVSAEDAAAEVERLDEQLRRLGAAHPNVAVRADTATARAALAQVREEIAALTARPGQVRLETDGGFGARMRAVVREAQASLPEVNVDADTSEAMAEMQSLRAQLASLADQRVGIDIDAATATAKVQEIQSRLARLSASSADPSVRLDAGRAMAQLALLRAEVAAVDRKRILVSIDTAGAQGAILNLGIQIAALTAIPAIPVIAAGLGAVASMAVAAGAGVGAFALAAVPAVKGVTEVIALQKQAQEEAGRATDDSAKKHVQAQQRAIQMASAQQALAAAHRSAARSIADADRQVADAQEALAQATEHGVTRRRQAEQQLADAQHAAAEQQKQAARSIADAERAAADQRAQSARAVSDAQRALSDAVQRAADQQRAAAQAIADAERRLADAHRTEKQAQLDLVQARREAAEQLAALEGDITRGALDQRDAKLRVLEAEQQLQAVMADPRATDLQRQQAQLAYDQAVQRQKDQAARQKQLESEAERARKAGVDGAKGVQEAEDRVADAQRATADAARALEQAHRAAARARSDATQAVADAERRVVDAQADSARSAQDSARAIADAQESAARAAEDSARAVADAQQGVAQAAQDSAQGVADATERVADAIASAERAQVDAADSVASAERGVASARLSTVDATTSAVTKADEYRKKLAELTPEQRDLYDSIAGPQGLKQAFKDWQESLQPDVLPLVTRGVDGIKNSLPGLSPLVRGAARGIDTLMDSASQEMKSPFWRGFKADLAANVQPAVEGFGKAFGNVIKGIAGIIDAFLPHMDGIAERSDSITARFANWGTSLKGSPDFERFLDYVKETSPGLAELMGDIFDAMIDVAVAASPWSEIMFDILSPLLDGLSWLSKNAPEVIQVIWGVYFATKMLSVGIMLVSGLAIVYESAMIVMSIATAGWGATLAATGVVPIIRAIILIVGLLVLAVIFAWNHFGWFRDGVKAAWDGISAAASFAWHEVLSPVFGAIWDGVQWLGDKALWLWDSAFKPAFDFIIEAGRFLALVIITIVITPIYLAIVWLGDIVMWLWNSAFKPALGWIADRWWWLWDKVISPVCNWIADKAKWLNDKAIKPATSGIQAALVWVGDTAYWLWGSIISPVFGWIADKAFWLYNAGIKPPLDLIKEAIGLAADAFEVAKDNIERYWNQVADIAKRPVKVIVDVVYNNGIRRVWNAVSGVVGGKNLAEIKGFHTGGIMSGYTPGRDDRIVAVGGGEAIMRPEWTRAVGADYVNSMNAAARQGGISGVQRLVNSGMPAFADGGVVGWVKGRVKDVGDFFSRGWDMLTDPSKIVDASREWATRQMDKFTTNPWGKQIAKMPVELFNAIKEKVKNAFDFGGDGYGVFAVAKALKWAKTQEGKPYQWGGGGNPSWDCSGFMSAIQKVIEGKNPNGHLWSTHAFSGNTAPRGWVRNLRAPFQIGITNAGVGHTAGTVAGVNVESRGGDGVVVGPRARGAYDSMFTDVYGFKPSMGSGNVGGKSVAAAQSAARQMLGEFGFNQGEWPALRKLWEGESNWRWNARNPSSGAYGIPQSLPADKMASAGRDWLTNPATQIKWGLGYIRGRYGTPSSAYASWLSRSPHWYDDGGYLPPGLSLVANGTGSPEPVFTSSQWDTLRASAGAGRGTPEIHADVHVYVGDREITDIVRVEVDAREASISGAIDTGRW